MSAAPAEGAHRTARQTVNEFLLKVDYETTAVLHSPAAAAAALFSAPRDD